MWLSSKALVQYMGGLRFKAEYHHSKQLHAGRDGSEARPSTLPEDLGWIPSTHVAAFSSRGANALLWLLRAPGTRMVHRYACQQNTHIHKRKDKQKHVLLKKQNTPMTLSVMTLFYHTQNSWQTSEHFP